MRRFFIFLFISFASLFFSQCKIGEISFVIGDFLMLFTNGKVERKNKKNEIQQIAKIEIKADKWPENEIRQIDNIKNGIERIDEIELEAKGRPENISQMVDQMTVLKKPRSENISQLTNEVTILGLEKQENIVESIDEIEIKTDEKPENVIEEIESIELLGKEKPQIEPELTNEFYLHGVVKPENKIERKDEFLIEGEKGEELQIVKVKKLLFSKKEQQKKTNEIRNAENLEILCAGKKNQNIICKNEQFGIISEGSGEQEQLQNNKEEEAQIIEENKEIEDELKNLEEDEEHIKEVIKVLQEYEGNHKEVLKTLQDDGMDEILKTSENADAAIPKIMEFVKKRREKEMLEAGKDINKKNSLDTKEIKEFRKDWDDDFKRKLEEINKKFFNSKEEFLDLKKDHLNLYLENMRLLEDQQKLKEELHNIRENSGCNNVDEGKNNLKKEGNVDETPRDKNRASKRYKESEILSYDKTQKKNFRLNSGYSRDKINKYDQELKEGRQSMLSSISRNLKFRSSSYSPCKSNRISFPPFFDEKKFCTDPREKKIIISENIYNIPQRDSYGSVLNKKVRNVGIDFEECSEISLQIKNGNEEMNLNNVNEGGNKDKKQIFTKINIFKKKENISGNPSIKSYRGTTAANTSKGYITRNNNITVGPKLNDIKDGFKNSKLPKLIVRDETLSTNTSFSTSSLSNSGMYRYKIGDKNIINNIFEQNKKKEDPKNPVHNTSKFDKKLFQPRANNDGNKTKEQIDLKKEHLETENNTSKNTSRNNIEKNNGEAIKKFYAKLRDFKKLGKNSGAYPGIQKIQQQKINRLKENNAWREYTKRNLNKVEDKKIFIYNSSRKIKKEEYTTTSKNSENSNNISNGFVSLGEDGNSNTVNAKRLKMGGEKW